METKFYTQITADKKTFLTDRPESGTYIEETDIAITGYENGNPCGEYESLKDAIDTVFPTEALEIESKIKALIKKGWANGRVEDDKPFLDWLMTADIFGTYHEDNEEKELTYEDFPYVQYTFGEGGIGYTIGQTEQDCNNAGFCCEDEWQNIDDLDFFLEMS